MIHKAKQAVLPILLIIAIIIVAYQYHTQFNYKKLDPGGKPSPRKIMAVTAHGTQTRNNENINNYTKDHLSALQ